MLSEQPSQVLALLRSGPEVEIGGRSSLRPTERKTIPSGSQLVLAFAAIYLIWGSTYLGIRYAIETIPPLLMMGIRHFVAGATVYAWARWRGAPGRSYFWAGTAFWPGRSKECHQGWQL